MSEKLKSRMTTTTLGMEQSPIDDSVVASLLSAGCGNRSAPEPKRKKTNELTIEHKKKVLDWIDGGVSQRTIAQKFGVGKSTVANINKNRCAILATWEGNCNNERKRKLRRTSNESVNLLVLKFFQKCRQVEVAVNGPLIQAKAKEISQRLGIENFQASNGWLDSFRTRNNIHFRFLSSEVAAETKVTAEDVLEEVFREYEERAPVKQELCSESDDDTGAVHHEHIVVPTRKDALLYVTELLKYSSAHQPEIMADLIHLYNNIENHSVAGAMVNGQTIIADRLSEMSISNADSKIAFPQLPTVNRIAVGNTIDAFTPISPRPRITMIDSKVVKAGIATEDDVRRTSENGWLEPKVIVKTEKADESDQTFPNDCIDRWLVPETIVKIEEDLTNNSSTCELDKSKGNVVGISDYWLVPETIMKTEDGSDQSEANENFLCEMCGMAFDTCGTHVCSLPAEDKVLQPREWTTEDEPAAVLPESSPADEFMPRILGTWSIPLFLQKKPDYVPQNCEVCGKLMKAERTMYRHKKTCGLKPFTCKYCSKRFATKESVCHHERLHTGERPFKCTECDKAFPSLKGLHTHTECSHWKGDRFPCETCGKTFASRQHRSMHQRNVHVDKKNYLCDVCGKSYKSSNSLVAHVGSHSGVGLVPHPCQRCGKMCKSRIAANQHRRSHDKKRFRCDECDKTFQSKDWYLTHQRNHRGEKPFACQYCGKTFVSKKYQDIHVRTHTGERPYKCELCGQRFTQRHVMLTHVKKLHASNDSS